MQFGYDVSTQYLRYYSLSLPIHLCHFSPQIPLPGTHISVTNTNVYTRQKLQAIMRLY